MRLHPLVLLTAALELVPACGQGPAASSGFTGEPHPVHPVTSTASSSGGEASTSTGSSSGEDSGSAAASGTSTGTTGSTSSTSDADTGVVPDFGAHPIGCQGKIDFLFVISSWYAMKGNQVQLQEAFPAFIDLLEQDFADFDYQVMVVDASMPLLYETCSSCYMCIGCTMPGCADFGGPPDYPCDAELFECDVTKGAGVKITGNFNASNKRCELFGDHRYIIKGEPDLLEAFTCIATVGEGPKTPVSMTSMQAAVQPDMLDRGGCNDGFLREDALLAIVILDGIQDSLTPGTPQDWYDTMVAAKNGHEEAIVVLALSNDHDLPNPKCPGPKAGPNPQRLFAETAAHGLFETICADSYVPALKKTAATILEQCSLLIPQ